MRQYLFWLFLLAKRMVKKPAFVLFLLGLPVLSVAITGLGQDKGEGTGITIGIILEKESQQDAAAIAGSGNRGKEEAWAQELLSLLAKQDSIIEFRMYERKEAFLQDIEKGALDCGVSLPADIQEKLMSDIWRDSVTIYKTSSSSMTEIVKERIASALFTLYSEESYVNYVEKAGAFSAAEAEGNTRTEIIAFAKEAYETHLLDGSTFAFQYHEEGYEGRQQDAAPVFRLRGVLAICIFLSGMCGLLTDWQDRQEKRFVRMAPEWMTTIVNIWIPTVYTSTVALLSLALTGQLPGEGSGWFVGVGKEMCHLIFYQFLIVIYCSIIRLILQKQELIAAAVPILTLAGIICCPVWIRLAVYLPIFRVLEKLFPVTYYLLL